MRQSYTVTVTADRSVSLLPFMKAHELRRKSSAMSGSVLVSTFLGLLINQVKVCECVLGEICVAAPIWSINHWNLGYCGLFFYECQHCGIT